MASSATVGALKVVLSADSAQFSTGMKQAEGTAQKFGAVIGKATAVVAAFGAAAAAAAALVAAQMRTVANRADEMAKAAQKVGLMTEELSALKYTADLAGVGFQSLQTSLVRLTRSMSDVAKGSDNDAAKAFKALGISVQNTDGSLKSSAQVMEEVAGKFATFKDGAEKTALAVAIFGRAGADMIPLLNQGADAIRESNNEAKAFGVTLSTDLGRASERFNDALSRIGSAFTGIWNAIGERLIPIFADWAEKIADTIKEMRLFEKAGTAMQWIIDTISAASIKATAHVRGLMQVWESFVNLFTKPISGGAAGMWAEMERGVAAYSAELKNAEARVRALHQASAGLINGASGILPSGSFSGGDTSKPDAPGIGGSGGGKATKESEYDAEKQRIEGKLQAIREGYMSEEALRLEKYEADRNLVDEAYQREIISAEQHNQHMLGLERKHLEEKARLHQAYWSQQAMGYASALGSMARVTESWGKKNNAVSKALGIAQALISTYVGATKALASAPFPANMAAFAAVMARGLATVAAITAVNPNGQSGGGARSIGSSGGGSVPAQAAPEQAPRSAYINVYGSTFSREQMRDLTEQLGSFYKDGGGRVVWGGA